MEQEYTMSELRELIDSQEGEFCIEIILGKEDEGNGEERNWAKLFE